MDNHFRRKLHENIVKTRVLQSGFWNAKVTAWRCKRHCMSRKCCTIPIFGRFLESCYIAHPRSHGKVPKNPVRGYGIRGKTAFRQEKCCTIRNLPRKSESCNKIRRFLPWALISWQVLAAWCPLQVWCLDGEARGSVACAGPADRDRGGDRVRERLDHARPAHGVRGALRQEPVRPTPQGYSRRRDHARPQPKELTQGLFPGVPALHLSMSLQ